MRTSASARAAGAPRGNPPDLPPPGRAVEPAASPPLPCRWTRGTVPAPSGGGGSQGFPPLCPLLYRPSPTKPGKNPILDIERGSRSAKESFCGRALKQQPPLCPPPLFSWKWYLPPPPAAAQLQQTGTYQSLHGGGGRGAG